MLIQNFLTPAEMSDAALPVTMTPVEKREAVQICVIGSVEGITGIIYDLHHRGFAEVNEWSKAQPTGNPGEYIRLLRRYILRRE